MVISIPKCFLPDVVFYHRLVERLKSSYGRFAFLDHDSLVLNRRKTEKFRLFIQNEKIGLFNLKFWTKFDLVNLAEYKYFIKENKSKKEYRGMLPSAKGRAR